MLSNNSLLIVFCLILSACGFQPLYGSKGAENIISDFSNIQISPTNGRTGQMLSNELRHLLNPLREPIKAEYRLITDITVSIQSLAVKKTALATRSNLTIKSVYSLIDTTNQKVLNNGNNNITVSYNIFSSQYATIAAEKNAIKRAIKELAQDIRLEVGAFFKNQNQLKKTP